MVAKGGASLLQADAVTALKQRMVPLAALLTPNAPEAEALTGLEVCEPGDAIAAARALVELGSGAVLMKGGHLSGDTVSDLLLDERGGTETFTSPRIDTRHTHGTGCTLASACAAGIAQGLPLRNAVARARAYVIRAIETAPGLGRGNGPLNHAHTAAPFNVDE